MSQSFPEAPPQKGERGEDEAVVYDLTKRSAIRMVQQALSQRWNIPDKLLEALPLMVVQELNKTPVVRNKIALTRLLITMASENRATAHMGLQAIQGPTAAVSVTVNGDANVTVDQKLSAEDITGVINELGLLGIVNMRDTEPEVPATQAYEEAAGVLGVSEDGAIP